jgi:ATP-dependent helicase/nuclease subunit A
MGDSDETVLIQGVIDAYIDTKDGIILVDYKTDNVKDADTLINRYKVQLELYKKSLEMSTGKNVSEIFIYSFALGKEIGLYE